MDFWKAIFEPTGKNCWIITAPTWETVRLSLQNYAVQVSLTWRYQQFFYRFIAEFNTNVISYNCLTIIGVSEWRFCITERRNTVNLLTI